MAYLHRSLENIMTGSESVPMSLDISTWPTLSTIIMSPLFSWVPTLSRQPASSKESGLKGGKDYEVEGNVQVPGGGQLPCPV